MWLTLRTYHPYAVVFTATGPEAKTIRLRKGLYLLTIQSMLMFIMAVFFNLQYPENTAYCAAFTEVQECEAGRSMFDNAVSTCVWTKGSYAEAEGGSCLPRTTEFSTRVCHWSHWIVGVICFLTN